MVTALNIANAILYKGFNEGVDLTPMKLQRLLYLTYKEFYKRTNTLLLMLLLKSTEVTVLKITIENIMEQF